MQYFIVPSSFSVVMYAGCACFQDASGRWIEEEIVDTEKIFKADIVLIACGFTGPEKTLSAPLGIDTVSKHNALTVQKKQGRIRAIFIAQGMVSASEIFSFENSAFRYHDDCHTTYLSVPSNCKNTCMKLFVKLIYHCLINFMQVVISFRPKSLYWCWGCLHFPFQ